MSKKGFNNEIEEYKELIDSRLTSEKEKEQERNALIAARQKRFRERPESEKLVGNLLQIKYQIENYLNNPAYSNKNSFPKFLSMYVDTLYKKRKDFASDLDINPIILSQIINNHRDPKEEFLIRLIVHSQAVFKSFGHFDRDLWPKLYYQDKMCEFLTTSEKRRKIEERHVNNKVVDI
ncbi:hypothetical protein [Autumnicola edwardsiae]|uniref:HTH cro/C1-type domain-containing protein n=1 Tax=Autumnicola edwardsiae TaxID=3075594 RepID=A0ABU3CWR1_9FLAO|nr:hypothetical protein [Zunongwangia sp. F297]MDT0650789.1 hypothetical protein [Zunongwangia sp. F297]